jgi:membrane associated rhomboid family serine protease
MRRRSYPGTGLNPILVIIAANLVIFIAAMISGRLFVILGLVPELFWERPWTIFTNMFVHAGFGHIFANMFTLFFFGSFLTRLVGSDRFLLVYFAGGVAGNILLLVLAPVFPFSIAVGASGGVFAVAGALTVMAPRLRVFIFPIPVPLPLWVAVIGGFILLSFMPAVAWQAHLGGLAFGLAAGYVFLKRARRGYS